MSSIQNVAVIGGGGNLGQDVVKALLNSNFTVTILTSSESKSAFPSGVQIKKIDYDSPSSLSEALKGQGAVVSVIGTAGVTQQQKLIDAAVQTGVRRFIPSEFGINNRGLEGGFKKILAGKIQTIEYLNKVAAADEGFTWTGLSTDLFFDWGLRKGSLGFSLSSKTATIFDSGNEHFNATTLQTIGLAIVSILQQPSKTANRYLDIASFSTTQNDILSVLEEETGTKWTVNRVRTDDNLKTGNEKLEKGDYSAFGDFLKVHLFRDGEGRSASREELANVELGLPEEDLKETIKSVL